MKSCNLTSIIIPTLNEASLIKGTLEAVFAMPGSFEVIVVDGGSLDNTLCQVRMFPEVRHFSIDRAGRAIQMNFGARHARGDYLLFLHADTRPESNCILLLEQQVRKDNIIGGSFRMTFDRPHAYYKVLSFLTRFNCRFWTFGDQGIFVKRSVFAQIKGYGQLPILEDLEFQMRLRKLGKFIKIPASLTTSARRYHQNGFWWEFLIDTSVVIAYFLGASPQQLKRWYSRKKRKDR